MLLFMGLKLKKQIDNIESEDIREKAYQIWEYEIKNKFHSILLPFYTFSNISTYSELLEFYSILWNNSFQICAAFNGFLYFWKIVSKF